MAGPIGTVMPISSHLLRKLQDALGAEAAEDLATLLESMDGIRGDIAELRHEMRLRDDVWTNRLAAFEEKMGRIMERGLREQTRFFFLAWSVLLAALVGLYAR